MQTTTSTPPQGLIARAVSRAAHAAARRPKRTIGLWLLLIVACTVGGSLVGTKTLGNTASGTGESQLADKQLTAAGLRGHASESVMVQSPDPARTASAVAAVESAVRALRPVLAVRGPADSPAFTIAGGRIALVQVELRGDPTKASDHVVPVQDAVSAVARAHPGVAIREAGVGSIDHEIQQIVGHDLAHSQLITLPVTLVILVLAFGAIVAASVPLLLGITSVVAAIGALGLVSQIAPSGTPTNSVVALIGLAVGVDYSLFYIRREREERRAGRSPHAALSATAATVGRAVVIAGLTVMVALAGLLFTGLGVFTSMALGAMLVVAIAVIGSVTVLPAVLALLGDRIDRGRVLRGRLARRRDGGAWRRVAGTVTGHPLASLICSACLLGTLAVPVLSMRTANPGESDLPAKTPVLVAEHAIDRSFPGSPATAVLVVSARELATPSAVTGLRELGQRALAVTHGQSEIQLTVARDGRTARLGVPLPDRGVTDTGTTIEALRQLLSAAAPKLVPGARVRVTGDAAGNLDVTNRLSDETAIVIGFVLALAFVLLVAAFRSPVLAASVIALNLLSVGAAFGVVVAVFQHHWAQSLLGFTSNGAIVMWPPLFAFVLLFGLSMDYTVLVLERVREARRNGADARTAASEALTSTGGTVTSAALVMIGVFSVFATLRLLEFKQLGVGLAAAIALDATIVRAVALPAAITLLGEWGVRRVHVRSREWDHQAHAAAFGTSHE
jgi:uncharacterized membrane protein YdfJ with MMPL/SSD domain